MVATCCRHVCCNVSTWNQRVGPVAPPLACPLCAPAACQPHHRNSPHKSSLSFLLASTACRARHGPPCGRGFSGLWFYVVQWPKALHPTWPGQCHAQGTAGVQQDILPSPSTPLAFSHLRDSPNQAPLGPPRASPVFLGQAVFGRGRTRPLVHTAPPQPAETQGFSLSPTP